MRDMSPMGWSLLPYRKRVQCVPVARPAASQRIYHFPSEEIELLGCVDQLDLGNLCGAEAIARHLQFHEHEVKKKQDAKRGYDQNEYFLGRPRRSGGALISPEVLEWVAGKAQKDSSILTEQRKAVEERALLRKAPNDPKK